MKQAAESFLENRCKTCLMPNHAITKKGDACNYCSPDKNQVLATTTDTVHNDNAGMTLDSIKELGRSSTGKYDCLVGLTGGRDSTYLLYYAKEILGLNPLAVNFDTGFMTDAVESNMQNCVSALGVDFIRFRIDWKFFQKLLRGFFINYGDLCSVCHQGHHYTLAKLSKENGITVILRGLSAKTDPNRIDPHFFDFFCKSEEEFNEKMGRFAKEEGITEEELEFHKDFLNIESWSNKDIKTIDLPDFLEYNFNQIQNILKKRFNWQHPPGQFIHGDCMLNPASIYLMRCRHGYSEKQVIISNLLAHRDIDVDQGKELLLNEENINSVSDIPNFDKVLNILNVTRAEFDQAVETHWK
jgi:hypothetical protein